LASTSTVYAEGVDDKVAFQAMKEFSECAALYEAVSVFSGEMQQQDMSDHYAGLKRGALLTADYFATVGDFKEGTSGHLFGSAEPYFKSIVKNEGLSSLEVELKACGDLLPLQGSIINQLRLNAHKEIN